MEDDEIDFHEYYLVIKNNIFLILAIFFVVMAGTLLYLYLTPQLYEAKAVVMLGENEDYFAQAEIAKSDLILTSVYSEIGKNFDITTFPIKNSNIIEIKARSVNPTIAKNAANKVAEVYLVYMNESKQKEVKVLTDVFYSKIDGYQQQLIVLNDLDKKYKSKKNLTSQENLGYQNNTLSIKNIQKLVTNLMYKEDEMLKQIVDDTLTIKIIDSAKLPSSPTVPNIKYTIVFGILMGCIFGFGTAYIKEEIIKKSRHHIRKY